MWLHVVLVVNYGVSHVLGYGLWRHEDLVQLCYEAVDDFCIDNGTQIHDGHGVDLGFNFDPNDTVVSLQKGQQNKWDYMLEELGLQQGDYLVDCGCWYGEWLNYARSKGIHVLGINISKQQAEYVTKKYGIEVVCTDWKDVVEHPEKYTKIAGKFDAITFMDTVEHYSSPFLKFYPDKQDAVYQDMFQLAAQLTKPTGRVFSSCLFLRDKPWEWIAWLQSFVIDHTMSGLYPREKVDPITEELTNDLSRNAERLGFMEKKRVDHTEDIGLRRLGQRFAGK